MDEYYQRHRTLCEDWSKPKSLGLWQTIPPELILEIFNYLSPDSLTKVALTHRLISPYATAALFKNNAKYDNSTAILWAAFASGSERHKQQAQHVLNASVKYLGNVNAVHRHGSSYVTALHISIHQGNVDFVRQLLEHGAHVTARCFQMHKYLAKSDVYHLSRDSSPNSVQRFKRLSNLEWLPLFVCVADENWQLTRLLIRGGAPGYVALRPHSGFLSGEAVTIFHLIVNASKHMFQEKLPMLINKYPCCLNMRSVRRQSTALFVAIRTGKEDTVTELLKGQANPNIPDVGGVTPLIEAIRGTAYTFGSPRKRTWYGNLAKSLLDHGANPNSDGPLSPLVEAISLMKDDWVYQSKPMAAVIDALLEHDVNVNVHGQDGEMVTHFILSNILKREGNKSLERILEALIKGGASINEPCHQGSSMLFKALDSETSPKSVTELLLEKGASILPDEADGILLRWVSRRRDKVLSDCVEKHFPHIKTAAACRAFNKILAEEVPDRMKKFEWLRSRFPSATVSSMAVAKAFLDDNLKISPGVLTTLTFDVKWVDEEGRGFLHLVVYNLQTRSRYKESVAILDTNNLIKAGISFLVRDREGKTALGRLIESKTEYMELEILFHRQRAKERGEDL
ncbi:hypothetical protein K4F52_002070 [Lecanicillium sp. MT-2017a]|nr:hypothetical protein K4F52_002070 [Lecanicillium sp. MT-2017a]